MRHAARVPPPPHFVYWCCVAAAGVWRVQVVGGGCHVSASFFEGSCFCSFIHDLYEFEFLANVKNWKEPKGRAAAAYHYKCDQECPSTNTNH